MALPSLYETEDVIQEAVITEFDTLLRGQGMATSQLDQCFPLFLMCTLQSGFERSSALLHGVADVISSKLQVCEPPKISLDSSVSSPDNLKPGHKENKAKPPALPPPPLTLSPLPFCRDKHTAPSAPSSSDLRPSLGSPSSPWGRGR